MRLLWRRALPSGQSARLQCRVVEDLSSDLALRPAQLDERLELRLDAAVVGLRRLRREHVVDDLVEILIGGSAGLLVGEAGMLQLLSAAAVVDPPRLGREGVLHEVVERVVFLFEGIEPSLLDQGCGAGSVGTNRFTSRWAVQEI